MREEEKRAQALLVLELDEGASWGDVESSYQRLLRLYSNHSLASYGLFRREERHTFLEALGKAHLRLKQDLSTQAPESSSPSSPDGPHKPAPGEPHKPVSAGTNLSMTRRHYGSKASWGKAPTSPSRGSASAQPLEKQESDYGIMSGPLKSTARFAQLLEKQESNHGPSHGSVSVENTKTHEHDMLRKARERAGLTIQELALRLSCSTKELELLESRQYDDFGSSRMLRLLVESYAAVVGLERQHVVTDILSDFWAWRAHWRKMH